MNQKEKQLVKEIEKLYKKERNEIHNRMYGFGVGELMLEKLEKLFKMAK